MEPGKFLAGRTVGRRGLEGGNRLLDPIQLRCVVGEVDPISLPIE
jgi:hypothetical protein